MSTAATEEDLSQWTSVLTAKRSLLEIRWRELWQYRDLVWLLVLRDITVAYKQTVLGPLWFIVNPLVTAITYVFIFGGVAKLSTDGTPKILFYFSGVIAWNYFSECLLKTSQTFIQNSQLFGKVYFPRLAVALSIVISNLVTFLVQFGFFLLIYLACYLKGAHVQPNWRIVIFPIITLQMSMLGMGFGCIVSALTTRYRDLSLAVRFGVQLWMFVTTVVYPLSEVAEKNRIFFILNPMVPVIESFRFAFLGAGVIELWQLGLSFVISVIVLLVGVIMFNKVEETVMDTI